MKESTIKDTTRNIKISQDALSEIVSMAAVEVDGVASLSSLGTEDSHICGKLLSCFDKKKTVNIDIANGLSVINLSVILKSNYKLIDVVRKVQKNIKTTVQNMTGLPVSKVNVYVANIDFSQS